MKRSSSFLKTVAKKALSTEHYWGRIKFSPGRCQIHLHFIAIAKYRSYLDEFYRARTSEENAAIVDHYANT